MATHLFRFGAVFGLLTSAQLLFCQTSSPQPAAATLLPAPALVAASPLQTPSPAPTTSPAANAFHTTAPVLTSASDSVAEYQRVLTEQSKNYQDFLRAETDRHQVWAHDIFELAAKAFGIGLALFLGYLGWSQWKTLASTKAEIAANFQAKAGALIDSRLEEFVKHVGASKTRVDEQVNEVKETGQKSLSNLQERIEEQLKGMKQEAFRQLDSLVDCASVVGHATVILEMVDERDESGAPKELSQATQKSCLEIVARLETLHREMPTNRTIAIFVGRMARRMGDLNKAIALLEETLKAREVEHLHETVDHAAVLYNKACYLNLLAGRAEGATQEKLRQRAWSALGECVKLSPSDRQDAQADSDFDGIISPPDREWATL